MTLRIALFALALAAPTVAGAQVVNDFPTEARADYVFGCMKSNGETQEVLSRCSCSIDVIATIIPYRRYEEASTFISMGLVTGEKGVLFRTSEESRAAIGDLRRAQAEAEIRCF
ncbi:hypothetical protein I5731_04015 [Methylobrevis sp. L22]|uniref:Uncharacterized protein n=1 Tax=Methylobrevis albus TaxID=2793297 RepID=A0A931MXJ6_9HYPH|nr:hypothetical protein [Methylobrevis albus]MBH0236980.1 hypothetical protein [Methylobrevis albus]